MIALAGRSRNEGPRLCRGHRVFVHRPIAAFHPHRGHGARCETAVIPRVRLLPASQSFTPDHLSGLFTCTS